MVGFLEVYLEEEVGSVVCLWILACWLSFSLRAVCTSAGMSGDVWLIFMAASSILTEGRPLAIASRGCFFSTSPTLDPTFAGEWGEGTSGKLTCTPFSAWADRALLLQMGQHSFQKTKRETTNRARPQKPTTTARRLIEMSTSNHDKTRREGRRRKDGTAGKRDRVGQTNMQGRKRHKKRKEAVRRRGQHIHLFGQTPHLKVIFI